MTTPAPAGSPLCQHSPSSLQTTAVKEAMEVNPSVLAPMKGPMASLPKLRRKPEVGTVECVRGSVSPLSDGPYVKAWAGEPVGSEAAAAA